MPIGQAAPAVVEYGPFHRVEAPTQTMTDAAMQEASGEVWGQTARGGSGPSVKAWRGPLPPGVRGVEFMTVVAPHHNPHPTLVQWREKTPGVFPKPDGFVGISARITENTQV